MKKHDISLQVWNRPEWTQRILKSLDENSNWDSVNRFFIMDDASEKTTEDIVKEYKNPKKIYIRENFGNSLTSLRKFVSLAETELVFNCENDVLVPKDWNSLLAQEFEKDSRIGIVRGVAQDLPAGLRWSTCHAGFRLQYLKKVIETLKTIEDRWIDGVFAQFMNNFLIHCVPSIYFDKLEYHEQELPLIHQYFLKGWERRDAGWEYRERFYPVTKEWKAKGYIK